MSEEYRIVEVLLEGVWTKIDFKHLTKGSVFRIFEPTGESVTDAEGRTDFVAVSDSYEKDGVWGITLEAAIK